MSGIELKNAIITGFSIRNERCLSMYLQLDYGGCGQGFGGFCLLPDPDSPHYEKATRGPNYAGIFISEVIRICDVDEISKIKGKTIRVKAEWGKVHEIGHIVKDIWFNPADVFGTIKENTK